MPEQATQVPTDEIITLYEFEDGSEPLGFYIKGHWPLEGFLAAVVEHAVYLPKDIRPTPKRHKAEHEWWHHIPVAGEPGRTWIARVRGPGPGTFAATVVYL